MHEHDALIASKTKLAFRKGNREGEIYYYDGVNFRRSYRGRTEICDRYPCLGLRDWEPYISTEYKAPKFKKLDGRKYKK